MFQAIVTSYIAATNFRGTRIKAIAGGRTLVLPYDSAISVDKNHKYCAELLQLELDWFAPKYGELIGGVIPNGDYVWVMANSEVY